MKKKIGLVLGSGAARGLSHIGVLKVLEKEGIHVDLVVGSSIGALVGGLYSSGVSPNEIENVAVNIDWKKLGGLLDFVVPVSGFINGKKVKTFIKTLIKEDKIENLEIPLSIVSTDIQTGEEIVINHGSLVDAIRASISIPGIFTPVKYDKRFLVDGGVVNPLPVSVAKKMGMDVIIAVNVISEPKRNDDSDLLNKNDKSNIFDEINTKIENVEAAKFVKNKLIDIKKMIKVNNFFENKKEKALPNIIDIMANVLRIVEKKIVELSHYDDAIIIRPDVSQTVFYEFDQARKMILAGEEAMLSKISEIKKRIK